MDKFSFLNRIVPKKRGVIRPTDLLKITGALDDRNITILSGPNSSGKSALALNIALDAAKIGKKTTIFSDESYDYRLRDCDAPRSKISVTYSPQHLQALSNIYMSDSDIIIIDCSSVFFRSSHDSLQNLINLITRSRERASTIICLPRNREPIDNSRRSYDGGHIKFSYVASSIIETEFAPAHRVISTSFRKSRKFDTKMRASFELNENLVIVRSHLGCSEHIISEMQLKFPVHSDSPGDYDQRMVNAARAGDWEYVKQRAGWNANSIGRDNHVFLRRCSSNHLRNILLNCPHAPGLVQHTIISILIERNESFPDIPLKEIRL